MGWRVLRFWGRDIVRNLEDCIKTVKETISQVKLEECIDKYTNELER